MISLSLVLALVGWSAVCAEDGFYILPVIKGKYAPVPKTGFTGSVATGDDGDLKKGVAWPSPRFTDHGNGTVTDKLTGLVTRARVIPLTQPRGGLQDPSCFISSSSSLISGQIE